MADRKATARKAAQTKLAIKFQQEQMRLLDFQHQLELAGYRFSGSALPRTPKEITAGSVRKLQNITPQYILKQATFLDDETGRVVGGLTQYKKEPPAVLKPPKTTPKKPTKKRSSKAKKPKKKKAKKGVSISRDRLIIDNLRYMLRDIGVNYPNVYKYLLDKLDAEVKQYGSLAVAQGIEAIPKDELMQRVNYLLKYGTGHYVGEIAFKQLLEMITLTIPTMDDIKAISAVAELDAEMEEE